MTIDYLAPLRDFHAKHIEPFIGKPDGCTIDEVNALEKQVGFELPLAYKQYLLWMGKDIRGIFTGSGYFLSSAIPNTQALPDILEETLKPIGAQWSLPAHYLVCFSHQGYYTAWFELPKTEDNPVLWWFDEILLTNTDLFDPPLKPEPQMGEPFIDAVLREMQALAELLPQTVDIRRAFREAAETGNPVTVDGWLTVQKVPPSTTRDKAGEAN
jgi:SMI1 / KNR4 family (SUKH-1)